MAVYQGTRLRSPALTVGTVERARRSSVPAPRQARVRPATAIMGLILAAALLGFVYLTQTLGSNAASAEIVGLRGTGLELDRQLRNQAAAVQFKADPVQIGLRAKKLGLDRLRDAEILTAP